jgi:uncharacterized protein (TIGR02996 family)
MAPNTALPAPAAALPGEADILATVVANLADDTAKLVYADWLEERDDLRGPLLRECVTAFRAGKKLPVVKAAPRPWRDLVGITLMKKLVAAKLRPYTDAILRLARPALSFNSVRASEAKLPLGASKLGGWPDVPPGTEWPEFDDCPMRFLAQFNFADLAASLACRDLPASGLLSVFALCDNEEGNPEYDPNGKWRLFYFPDTSALFRHRYDEEAKYDPFFTPCRLTFAETLTVPDPDSPWKKELGFGDDDEAEDNYQELLVEDLGNPGHRLLGYGNGRSNDVHGRKDVRHLLTLDSDNKPDWVWGDGGLACFMLSEGDLKARRFDRVRVQVQSN